MQDYRKFLVWRKAHWLVLAIHRITQGARRGSSGALVTQLRRAAISIPANIAEGCGHAGSKELARFLQIALASAYEVEYHLLLARDLHIISPTVHGRLEFRAIEIKRMLASLIQRVRASPSPRPVPDERRAAAIPMDAAAPQEKPSPDDTPH